MTYPPQVGRNPTRVFRNRDCFTATLKFLAVHLSNIASVMYWGGALKENIHFQTACALLKHNIIRARNSLTVCLIAESNMRRLISLSCLVIEG